MVRINIINPKKLADQHLIAEYNEILMLIGYVRKYPKLGEVPSKYTLGKGHVLFFKNKLKYLKKRHELIKIEMKKRGFKTNKKISLSKFKKELIHDWKPSKAGIEIIKKRLKQKIRFRSDFYRYYGVKRKKKFFIDLLQ